MILDSTKEEIFDLNNVEKFSNLFGKALKEDYDPKVFITVSANRWLGLLQLNKLHNFYISFRRFTIKNIPKKNKLREIIKFGKYYFDFRIVRIILKEFFENSAFESNVEKINKISVLIFKLGEYGLILGEIIKGTRISQYETEYNWNDIFLEITVKSDMIL